MEFSAWEYCPVYGRFSRLVFLKTEKDTYTIEREYKMLGE